jgi:predicted nucleic acid-binding Zn ribbon protein
VAKGELRSLRELLDGAARRAGLAAGAEVGRIWNLWPEIVGEDIAAHAEPTSLRDGILRVRTDSQAWATELSYLTDEIRHRANNATGKELIIEVRVWTGPGPVKRVRSQAPRTFDWRPSQSQETDPEVAFERARSAWWARRKGQPR